MMKLLLLPSALLLFSFGHSSSSSELVSRSKRQSNSLPSNFQCNLCNKCDKPCDKTCALCTGCRLAKRLGLSLDNLEDCKRFCGRGVKGCVRICESSKRDCRYCRRLISLVCRSAAPCSKAQGERLPASVRRSASRSGPSAAGRAPGRPPRPGCAPSTSSGGVCPCSSAATATSCSAK